MGVNLPSTRVIEREGVNAAQALFERNGCVFQAVDQQNDFGKDAYVDIGCSGTVTPFCVAVQIKSGESYRMKSGDYVIPVNNHADNWRRSTVPVFGLVYDPADRLIRWVDVTAYLCSHPQQNGGVIPVSRDAVLNDSTLEVEFSNAIGKYAEGRTGSIALNLLSDGDAQTDAVFDAWALGRHDARFLIILRRLILDLRAPAVRRAIVALSHAAPHPDIFWTKDNWIPPHVEQQVQESFRWSPQEVAHMISVFDVEDFGRGTLGQCFDVLMYEDRDVAAKLRSAIGILLEAKDMLRAVRAATVALAHSRNPRGELSLIIEEYPDVQHDEWFQAVAATVQNFGSFTLY